MGLGQSLTNDPVALAAGDGNQGFAWSRIGSEPAPTEGDRGIHGLRDSSLDSSSSRGCRQITLRCCVFLGIELSPGFENGLPAGAPAQMGQESLLNCRCICWLYPLLFQGIQPDNYAWRAEPALTGAGITECVGPSCASIRFEPINCADVSALNPTSWCHTSDARLSVDLDRAAAALSLWTATILHRRRADFISKNLQQGCPFIVDLMRHTIDEQVQILSR